MLNEYLLAAYRQNQTKLASRQLDEKLAQFPLQDLIALANGDPTAKLAYCDGPCADDGPKTWLDKFKGSPLFEKAVTLEKSLLEADAASDAKRTEERETDRELDAQRDTLRMQKRMLDLDLALEQEGGAVDPAATAAPVAPAEPAPTGGGTAVEVKQASLLAQFRKVASATGMFLPETRSLGKIPATDRAQGAGAGEYSRDPSEIVTGGLQVDKVASASLAAIMKPKTAPVDRARLAQDILREYPDFAGGKKEAAIKRALSLGGVMQGAKALGTGAKTLATTAHAAGGIPQVAKSFGNVAVNLAKQNPLATAGIAAGAAGLGGAALGRATAPRNR